MKGQCLKPLDQGVIFLIWNNGEGGIRTLAPLARSIPLAGAPLQPLEYFSKMGLNGLEPSTSRLSGVRSKPAEL